jgi:hypothetical protein
MEKEARRVSLTGTNRQSVREQDHCSKQDLDGTNALRKVLILNILIRPLVLR